MDGSPYAPSQTGEGDEYTLWDAAYVLGSLSDADRRAFEAHLLDCRSCSQSVEELSDMPAFLGLLTEDDVSAIDDRVASLDGGVASLAGVRRRGRIARAAILAAAAAVLVIGVLTAQFHWGSTTSIPSVSAAAVPMKPVGMTELRATVSLTGHDWGTQIEMNCIYPKDRSGSAPDGDEPSNKLAMVVVGRDGSQDRLATWTVVEGVHATPAGTTSMPVDRIAAVEIVSADTGGALLRRTV
jgi:putative zinc finger protein